MLCFGGACSSLRLDTATRVFDLTPGSPDTPEIGGLNEREDIKSYKHTFKTLSFEGVAVANPVFMLIRDMMTRHLDNGPELGSHIRTKDNARDAEILLGMNVLKPLHLYIAYGEKKLYITPAETPAVSASK